MRDLEEATTKFAEATNAEKREAAFRELALHLQRAVIPEIRRQCWNHDDVESVLQETLIKVAQRLTQLKDPGSVRAWAFQIAKHTAMDFNRARSRKPATVFSVEELEDAVQRGIAVHNPPLAPDEIARLNDLKSVIMRLGKRCQELLTEALDGLTASEMSEKTGERLESVAASLARCRRHAREALRALEANV